MNTLPVEVFEDVTPPAPVVPPVTMVHAPSRMEKQATRTPQTIQSTPGQQTPTTKVKAIAPSKPVQALPRPIVPDAQDSQSSTHPPVTAQTPPPANTPAPARLPTPPATPDPAAPQAGSAEMASRPGNGPAAVSHDDDRSPASPASTGSSITGPARATYQPLPQIPDDDRAEAYAAVALARFTVHPDGSADVSLIQATHNPTLNRLLLASLRQWHFTAARQDGHAIETTLELRVHFNVE